MKLIDKHKTEYTPRITTSGYDSKGYFTLAMNPLPEITVISSKNNKYSERPITMVTANGDVEYKTGYNPSAGYMSGTDPLGELYVSGVALDPVFRWLGKLALWGLGKTGNKWARSKILSSLIDLSTSKGLTNEGKNLLINNNMLTELDFFGPHKVKHFPNTVGEVYKGHIKGVSSNTPTNKLSLDDTYTVANYSMGNRGASFIHGTSPKDKLIHTDASGPLPVDNLGFLPKLEGYTKVDVSKGEVPEIWWNKHSPYYPGELANHKRTIVTSLKSLEDAGLSLDGTKGIESRVLHNPGRVPFDKIEFGLEPNAFGWYDKVKYVGNTLKSKSPKTINWYNINKPQASQFVGNNVNGEPLYMPDLEVFSKGKEMATKFFSHPVVKQSYKHNLELAKRLGVNIPDRNPADVVSKPINVKLSGASGDNYAEILQSHYGDPDALIRYNWIPMTRNLLLQASIHENLHRGFYSAAPRMKSMTTDYYNNQYLPEGRFYKWKTLKLLKPEYYEGYLGDYEGGEAGPNLIDLGRELGLKLGQKYPGYEVVKEMLSKYNGYKKFIIPQLNNSRAGIRHVWDAMTGRYFVLPAIATSTLNNTYNE